MGHLMVETHQWLFFVFDCKFIHNLTRVTILCLKSVIKETGKASGLAFAICDL